MEPKVLSISIPEYKLESTPDYVAVGEKLDNFVANNFEGSFLVRALSMIDHPKLTLDSFVDIILKTGTDKYDPDRKGVAHEEFEAYKPDIQAGLITVGNGKISESFTDDIKRFYENTLLDRGYRLRIDVLVFYNPDLLELATKIDLDKPSTAEHLEQYLYRFKNPNEKQKALVGIIKILN